MNKLAKDDPDRRKKLDVLADKVDFDGVKVIGRTPLNKLALYWAVAKHDIDFE